MNLQEIQRTVERFSESAHFETSLENRALDLSAQVGELSKQILAMNNHGHDEVHYEANYENELGDAFFDLILLANHFDVDLERSLVAVLEKYQTRLDTGSESAE